MIKISPSNIFEEVYVYQENIIKICYMLYVPVPPSRDTINYGKSPLYKYKLNQNKKPHFKKASNTVNQMSKNNIDSKSISKKKLLTHLSL